MIIKKSKQSKTFQISHIRTSKHPFCWCLTLSGVKNIFSWLLLWTRRKSKFYKSRTSHHFTLSQNSASYTQHRAVHKTISKLIAIWLIAYSFAIIVKRRGGSSKQLVTWVLTLFTSQDEVKVFSKFSKSFSSELAQQQPHIQVVWSTLVLARGGKAIPMATGKFYLGGALPVLPAVTWPGDNHQRCFPMSDSWEAPSPAGFSHLSWNEQRHQVNTHLLLFGASFEENGSIWEAKYIKELTVDLSQSAAYLALGRRKVQSKKSAPVNRLSVTDRDGKKYMMYEIGYMYFWKFTMDWVRIHLFLTHFWYFWDVDNNVYFAELETWQWTLQWSRRPRRAWGRSWRSLPSLRSCWASRPSDFFMTSSPSSLGTREPCQANISNSSLLN